MGIQIQCLSTWPAQAYMWSECMYTCYICVCMYIYTKHTNTHTYERQCILSCHGQKSCRTFFFQYRAHHTHYHAFSASTPCTYIFFWTLYRTVTEHYIHNFLLVKCFMPRVHVTCACHRIVSHAHATGLCHMRMPQDCVTCTCHRIVSHAHATGLCHMRMSHSHATCVRAAHVRKIVSRVSTVFCQGTVRCMLN
jgi:hypothetical protein